MDLELPTEGSNEAPQGGDHVILALLDARDLSLGESSSFSELGLRHAELLSKCLQVQLDDLLLDPGCVGGPGLGRKRASGLHFRPSLQLSISHHLPPQSRLGTL